MELPAALRAAVARELEGVSRKGLAERAQRASAAYRAGRGSAGVIREAEDALAYALARLPATYAACASVFDEAAARAPGFAPKSLLDAGAGPAGASWAALEAWPEIASVAWLDESPSFLAIAARLAAEGPLALSQAAARRCDLAAAADWPRADLVACSYALAEIAPERQATVVAGLWSVCDGVLALVEPGTPAGFARLRAAREALLAAGAVVLAPCPADAGACPMTGDDWCHFSVRLPRSRDHRLAKGAELAFEDEPFAYLLAARPGVGAAAAARVLAPPRSGKPGVELKLCGPEGLERPFVGKRDKAGFSVARRLGWGDATD